MCGIVFIGICPVRPAFNNTEALIVSVGQGYSYTQDVLNDGHIRHNIDATTRTIHTSPVCHTEPGLGKVAAGFVRDVLIGMELAHSPRLSDIARALEEGIGLRATHKRLSRNAARSELAPIVSDNLLGLAVSHVHDNTLLFLDWPILLKKRAEKMENLTLISDAKGNGIGNGYHLAEVVASEIDTDSLIPLAQSIWPEINAEADFLRHTLELVRACERPPGTRESLLQIVVPIIWDCWDPGQRI